MDTEMSPLDRLLEATATPPVRGEILDAEVTWPEEDPQEEMLNDLLEGITLLTQAQTLLMFLADPVLCETLTKRERSSMKRLAEKIYPYLATSRAVYDEVRL